MYSLLDSIRKNLNTIKLFLSVGQKNTNTTPLQSLWYKFKQQEEEMSIEGMKWASQKDIIKMT